MIYISVEIALVFCSRRDALYARFLYCIPDKRCREREEGEQKLVKRSLKARDTRELTDRKRERKRGPNLSDCA